MAHFEFVVSSGTPLQRATTKTRSHAVKSGLQKKCKDQEPSNSRDSQLVTRQASSLKGRFRVSTNSTKEPRSKVTNETSTQNTCSKDESAAKGPARDHPRGRRTQPTQRLSLWKSPSQGNLDPFGVFPIDQPQGVDNLIKFFLSYLDLDVSKAQITKLYLGYAFSDPLVLHTTLGIAAATWANIAPDAQLASREGWRQKAAAIPAIQKRLENNDTSNVVLGAIANLAQMEGLSGDYQTSMIHLKAVAKIVQARGGFSVFVGNTDVGLAITWPDLIIAIAKGSKPLFPLIHDCCAVSLPTDILTAAEQPSLSHLKVFERDPDDTMIRFTFSTLRQAYYASRSSEVPSHQVRIVINGLDHRIAGLLPDLDTYSVQRILLLTAQIFIIYIIRDTHVLCALPRILTPRLMRLFQHHIDDLLQCRDQWFGVLWCLFIGFTSTPRLSTEWDYFRTTLVTVLEKMGLSQPEQIKFILQKFLWDNERCDVAFQDFLSMTFPPVEESVG